MTLPNETLLDITSRLTHIHYLHALSLTCRRLHGLADNGLHLLAARRHPYLLCWACGTGNIRLVEKLLDAGVDPNRPFRFATEGRIGWSKDLICSPMDALDTVYGHSLWNAAYSNAEKRTEECSTEVELRTSNQFQRCCDEDKALFSRLPIKTGSSQFDPRTYFNQLIRLDEAYDPLIYTDQYWLQACYWFPLHTAVMIDCDSIVRLLLKRGAYINVPSLGLCDCYHCLLSIIPESVRPDVVAYGDLEGDNGELMFTASTPIHIALCHNRESMASLLITLGSTIVIGLDNPQSTAFHLAASEGILSIMQLLLDKQLAEIDAQDHLGLTPLLHAHGKPHSIHTIRWLLDHGADVNYSLGPNCKPLHVACYYAWYREANVLIDAGAAIGAPYEGVLYNGMEFDGSDGFLPVTLACMDSLAGDRAFSNWKKRERNVKSEESYGGYKEAVEREAVQLVKRLLAAGTSQLRAALLAATAAHRPWLMELLVEAGASVTLATHILCGAGWEQWEGEFPLIAAVASDTPLHRESRPLETISWLLERGANMNQANLSGSTIFDCINPRLDRDTANSITTFLRTYQSRGLLSARHLIDGPILD